VHEADKKTDKMLLKVLIKTKHIFHEEHGVELWKSEKGRKTKKKNSEK